MRVSSHLLPEKVQWSFGVATTKLRFPDCTSVVRCSVFSIQTDHTRQLHESSTSQCPNRLQHQVPIPISEPPIRELVLNSGCAIYLEIGPSNFRRKPSNSRTDPPTPRTTPPSDPSVYFILWRKRSIPSVNAIQLASIILSETPTVPHVRSSSLCTICTRVLEAVAA